MMLCDGQVRNSEIMTESLNPLHLFRTHHLDYLSIAERTGSTEAKVEIEIHRLRKLERQPVRDRKSNAGKIAYAGYDRTDRIR